ncbi:hypothetical protein CVT25_012411 [Psilocybe cyanescens]|uniref:VWFA domain-containing protein n=1 Tax=Psilocybe cyanescens TaxID=93625 RepID=A0A409X7M9_PSICY|nr:hypothetical protein CVT25_012411 [Psilocybe cyanescens]
MPLEATMLIIDNSEYMRNGDYTPTRPEVLVTHTKDHGPILNGILSAKNKAGGEIDIPTALAVAQLALKHRENKNLRQRIIVFVGSPPGEGEDRDEQAMIKLAKKLKKNNVAVDIVAFGDGIEDGAASRVLKAFIDNVNSSENSHLLAVPPGTHLLSDALISSPILSADRSAAVPEELGGTGAAAAGGSSSANDFEFGVDPSLDPELAMALRMSMQEAQAREAAATAAASGATASSAPTTSAETPAPATTTTTTSIPADPTDDEEERLLQQALAMSQEETTGEDADGDVEMDDEEDDDEEDDEEDDDDEEEDEDAAIARAIKMSIQTQEEDKSKAAPKKK